MSIGESDIWDILSEYARNLGLLEKTIKIAKQDYDTIRNDHDKIRKEVYNKYANRLNTSVSWNNFEWFDGLTCFYLLQFLFHH